MSRNLIVIVTLLSVVSLSGCDTMGKGKGKAPPPAVETAEPAPVYK